MPATSFFPEIWPGPSGFVSEDDQGVTVNNSDHPVFQSLGETGGGEQQ